MEFPLLLLKRVLPVLSSFSPPPLPPPTHTAELRKRGEEERGELEGKGVPPPSQKKRSWRRRKERGGRRAAAE